MEKNIKRLTVRINDDLLFKLHDMAEYEGRTVNRQIINLIKKCITEFEKEHGEINISSENTSTKPS